MMSVKLIRRKCFRLIFVVVLLLFFLVCLVLFMNYLYLNYINMDSIQFSRDSVQIPEFNSEQMSELVESDRTRFSNISVERLNVSYEAAMSPRELQAENMNIMGPGQYADLTFLYNCYLTKARDELFHILNFWIDLAAQHSIPWWMTYGSLLGAFRHADIIPWDTDIDIGIPGEFEMVLRNISTPRKEISSKNFNLVVRPGRHCPFDNARLDCLGDIVSREKDDCSFCGPLGRVFQAGQVRMDVYLYHNSIQQRPQKGRKATAKQSSMAMILDEGRQEFKLFSSSSIIDAIFPRHWLFPLKNCTFIGLAVLCPHKQENFLNWMYGGKLEPTSQCVDSTWAVGGILRVNQRREDQDWNGA